MVVRLSSLGDVAQALPIGGLLHHEAVRTAWVVEERCAGLLALARWPIEVLVWSRGWRGLRKILGAGRGYDATLDLQGNWKSGLVAGMLGADRVIGLAREDLRERGNALFSDARAAPARGRHVLERSLRPVEVLLGRSLSLEDLPRPPFLRVREQEMEAVAAALRQRGLDPARPLVAVVVGKPTDPRTWPHEQARALARSLGCQAFLLAGPAEPPLDPGQVPLLRQGSGELGALAALGATLARTGGVAVGHDGGAMHTLYAAGARCLFLFGPQDPARTGPPGGATLVAPEPLVCRPCLQRACRLVEGPVCMSRIDADTVRVQLDGLLDTGGSIHESSPFR